MLIIHNLFVLFRLRLQRKKEGNLSEFRHTQLSAERQKLLLVRTRQGESSALVHFFPYVAAAVGPIIYLYLERKWKCYLPPPS